jgi:hypothetical protein
MSIRGQGAFEYLLIIGGTILLVSIAFVAVQNNMFVANNAINVSSSNIGNIVNTVKHVSPMPVFQPSIGPTPTPSPTPSPTPPAPAIMLVNASGNNLTTFFPTGLVVLRGGCYFGASGYCASPPDGSFIIRDTAGASRAFINASGSLCIEDANCNDADASCSGAPDGSFIVKNNSGNNVLYISPTGTLCITGQLLRFGAP